jgi:phosphate transport system permease protein
MFSFIIGTVLSTLLAVILAAPPAILSAIYLHEYASKKIMTAGRTLIDLLAGIPSVVFGLWGIITVVPLVRNHIAPAFGINTTGYCLLSCGLVLSIMIVPVIMLMVIEVLDGIPNELRESSLALGATRWQTVKHVVMRMAYPGILSAVALGISRAIGETMAVLMVAGNVPAVPSSVFEPVYPLPALIANNYGEMLSIPLYDSALMFSALVLLAMVLVFNIGLHIFKKTARYGGQTS